MSQSTLSLSKSNNPITSNPIIESKTPIKSSINSSIGSTGSSSSINSSTGSIGSTGYSSSIYDIPSYQPALEVEDDVFAGDNCKEVSRIDRNQLKKLTEEHLRDINTLISSIKLYKTKHYCDRLNQYLNKLSHCLYKGNRYIELTKKEHAYLSDINNVQSLLTKSILSEIGFNANQKICKLSFRIDLNEAVPELYKDPKKTRQLFFAISPNGAIKTFFIYPADKSRASYGGDVPYYSSKDINKILKWSGKW
jgi:hypothetical protein